jgi:hypothetical protein
MAGCFMIVGRLWRVAPIANRREIVVVVGSAVFQCDLVINIPIIGRPELALALVAQAVTGEKNTRPALRRH